MAINIIGDPKTFAIEWSISESFASRSQMALGYFIVHVSGTSFGVRSESATLLASSFNEVKRRLLERGLHKAKFSQEPATHIVSAVRIVIYDGAIAVSKFFDLTPKQFEQKLRHSKALWCPDGDAAFDDGGHVLQFDLEKYVRLVAFKNLASLDETISTSVEVCLESSEYYTILRNWLEVFESEWESNLTRK
jgi:Immunity protein 42